MHTLLDDLQKLLQKQTDLYKKLLSVLRAEHEIILNSSVDDLHTNNKKKEVVILQIKLLDESCEKILEKIYQKLPAGSSFHSLSDFIEHHQHPSLSPLQGCHAALLAIVHSVKDLNASNERLIKGSLRAIVSSITFLASKSCTASPFYKNTGHLAIDAIPQIMLSEEA